MAFLQYSPAMKVIVVEDESKVRKFIKEALVGSGMVVDGLSSFEDLMAAIQVSSYDVVILDRLLMGHDCVDSISAIRRHSPDMKILVLSALSEVDDKVKGFAEGADDYLGKPFHISELIARVRSLMRRSEIGRGKNRDAVIEYKDLKVDLDSQRVYRGGKRLDLTGKEFRTLCLLARKPGQVFSKFKILDEVWDMNHFPESNVVEVTIANLRNKIDKDLKPLIHSRRGVGYWLGDA